MKNDVIEFLKDEIKFSLECLVEDVDTERKTINGLVEDKTKHLKLINKDVKILLSAISKWDEEKLNALNNILDAQSDYFSIQGREEFDETIYIQEQAELLNNMTDEEDDWTQF